MLQQGNYNIYFDIASIMIMLFLLAVCVKTKDRRQSEENYFYLIIIFLTLSAVLDLIHIIMRNDPSLYVYSVASAAIHISHIVHNSVAFLYAVYVIHVTKTNYLMNLFHKVLLAVPEVILIIVSVIPSIQNMLYMIAEDGTYTREPLYPLYFVISAVYFIIMFLVLIKYRRSLPENAVYIGIFCIGSIISVIFAALFPYLRATIFIQSICALGVFITIENESTIFDRESGALTSYALSKEAKVLYSEPFHSFVLSLKLPDIDTYISIFGIKSVTELIRGIASYLTYCGGKNSRVFYPSKGSFAMIMYNTSNEEGLRKAEEIRERFNKKWDVPGINLMIPVQIWVTDVPKRINSAEQLETFCMAPYDINISSAINVVDTVDREKRYKEVEEAIRNNIRRKLLKVYYQPVIDTETGELRSAEALVRCTDERLGAIPPEEIIAVAEYTGLIGKIGEFVFEQVCRFCAEVHPEQYGVDFISVNLSAVQCMDMNLPHRLSEIAKKHGTNKRRINLEISGSIFSFNEEIAGNVVNGLRKAGFLISLDDFGKHNTDFNDLILYPFSVVKIDRGMLWAAGVEEKKDIILRHLIRMIQDMKCKVVVEGVETEAQRDMLIKLNVEYLQGFLYSLPMSEDEYAETIRK